MEDSVEAELYLYGKPLVSEGGPIVSGRDHAILGYSAGLATTQGKELLAYCDPFTLMGCSSLGDALSEKFLTSGILLIRHVSTKAGGDHVIATRIRSQAEAGEGKGGRLFTVSEAWVIQRRDWARNCSWLIPVIGKTLTAAPPPRAALKPLGEATKRRLKRPSLGDAATDTWDDTRVAKFSDVMAKLIASVAPDVKRSPWPRNDSPSETRFAALSVRDTDFADESEFLEIVGEAYKAIPSAYRPLADLTCRGYPNESYKGLHFSDFPDGETGPVDTIELTRLIRSAFRNAQAGGGGFSNWVHARLAKQPTQAPESLFKTGRERVVSTYLEGRGDEIFPAPTTGDEWTTDCRELGRKLSDISGETAPKNALRFVIVASVLLEAAPDGFAENLEALGYPVRQPSNQEALNALANQGLNVRRWACAYYQAACCLASTDERATGRESTSPALDMFLKGLVRFQRLLCHMLLTRPKGWTPRVFGNATKFIKEALSLLRRTMPDKLPKALSAHPTGMAGRIADLDTVLYILWLEENLATKFRNGRAPLPIISSMNLETLFHGREPNFRAEIRACLSSNLGDDEPTPKASVPALLVTAAILQHNMAWNLKHRMRNDEPSFLTVLENFVTYVFDEPGDDANIRSWILEFLYIVTNLLEKEPSQPVSSFIYKKFPLIVGSYSERIGVLNLYEDYFDFRAEYEIDDFDEVFRNFCRIMIGWKYQKASEDVDPADLFPSNVFKLFASVNKVEKGYDRLRSFFLFLLKDTPARETEVPAIMLQTALRSANHRLSDHKLPAAWVARRELERLESMVVASADGATEFSGPDWILTAALTLVSEVDGRPRQVPLSLEAEFGEWFAKAMRRQQVDETTIESMVRLRKMNSVERPFETDAAAFKIRHAAKVYQNALSSATPTTEGLGLWMETERLSRAVDVLLRANCQPRSAIRGYIGYSPFAVLALLVNLRYGLRSPGTNRVKVFLGVLPNELRDHCVARFLEHDGQAGSDGDALTEARFAIDLGRSVLVYDHSEFGVDISQQIQKLIISDAFLTVLTPKNSSDVGVDEILVSQLLLFVSLITNGVFSEARRLGAVPPYELSNEIAGTLRTSVERYHVLTSRRGHIGGRSGAGRGREWEAVLRALETL